MERQGKRKERERAVKLDILKDKERRLFLHYLVPAIGSTLVTSIYILADTMFIGQGIGPDGLSALNMALPMFSVLFGLGLLFGVGGSVLMAIARGRGREEEVTRCFSSALVLALAAGVLCCVLGKVFVREISLALGCDQTTLPLTVAYLDVIFNGAFLFVLVNFLSAFVRNDKAPGRAMLATITGGVSNIVLDYIFIFPLKGGMAGAAWATLIGTAITACILCTHFFSKGNTLRFSPRALRLRLMGQITFTGVSSFVVEISSGVVVFLFNYQLMRYRPDIGVAVYSIVANYAIVVTSVVNGVAQAIQPLMGNNMGAGQWKRIGVFQRMGLMTALGISAVLAAFGILFPYGVCRMFVTPTQELLSLSGVAIRIYFPGFLFMGLNLVYNSYFQSIHRPKASLLISLLRGLILIGVCVFTLPQLLDLNGIWASYPVAEFLTFLTALVIAGKIKRLIPVSGEGTNL